MKSADLNSRVAMICNWQRKNFDVRIHFFDGAADLF